MDQNDLITQFYLDADSKGYTHLLWQDADLHISGNELLKLLSYVVVVAAGVHIQVPLNQMKDSVINIIKLSKLNLL